MPICLCFLYYKSSLKLVLNGTAGVRPLSNVQLILLVRGWRAHLWESSYSRLRWMLRHRSWDTDPSFFFSTTAKLLAEATTSLMNHWGEHLREFPYSLFDLRVLYMPSSKMASAKINMQKSQHIYVVSPMDTLNQCLTHRQELLQESLRFMYITQPTTAYAQGKMCSPDTEAIWSTDKNPPYSAYSL